MSAPDSPSDSSSDPDKQSPGGRPEDVVAVTTARSWLVWGVALTSFFVAVMNRTSLGVAAEEALDRFHIGPSQFSLFVVVQVAVYALLQVPVGVVLDRVGTRVMVVSGLTLMALGQATMAIAVTVEQAIGARVLVGAGDAMIFISLTRLVPAWFSSRHVPVVTQLTGQCGQLGQILSAVPLLAILHTYGWTPAYLSAAGGSVLVGAVILIVVRDRPPGVAALSSRVTLGSASRSVLSAARTRGTQLGFWAHFTVQYSGMVFLLVWGYPFIVSGLGYSAAFGAAMLSLMAVVSALVAPFLGRLTAAYPLRRSNLVFLSVCGTVLAWTAVLAWPGVAPMWVVLVLVVALAVNGPTSMVGFDFARTFNPVSRLGSATGIVNTGGYIACLVTIWLVGAIMQARGGDFSLDNFKVAFTVQYAVWGFGFVMHLWTRRRIRQEVGGPPDHFHTAVLRHLRSRRP